MPTADQITLECGCKVEMDVTVVVVLGDLYVKDIVGGKIVEACSKHTKPVVKRTPKKEQKPKYVKDAKSGILFEATE